MEKLTKQEKKAVFEIVYNATHCMYVCLDNREEEEITKEVVAYAENEAYKSYQRDIETIYGARKLELISEKTLTNITNAVIKSLMEIFHRVENEESADDSLEETQDVLDQFGYLE